MLAHTCYLTDPRVRREAEALAENGVEVHVISLAEERNGARESSNVALNGVQIHRLPVSRRRGGLLRYVYEYLMTGLLGGLRLALLHFRRGLDAVHIHNMPDILVLAALIPRISGSKLVLDIHDPMPELYMSWNHGRNSPLVRILRFQEQISCWLADRVISVNETMRENLQAKRVAAWKIGILHNYPDHNHFQMSDMPTSWPHNADSVVMLYSGTVSAHYDIGLAVKAMARLAGEVPLKLRIMGDGNRLGEILTLASALGVAEAIEVLAKVPIEDVARRMRNADVGISCHQAGVFGDLYFSTKLLEYLTQALCVVTPRTLTISRYLPDDCVFYFEAGNDAALADTMRFIWQNPAEVLRRLSKGRELVSRLSWQVEKDSLYTLYDDLLADERRGHGRRS
jgi:glycosyltransferase involved in cell wall biosynthesis